MTKTVLFVHGAWLTPKAWNGWRARFEAVEYATVAPTWPHMDRPIDALRKAPDPALTKLGVVEFVDHYATEIAKLDEPPIIIGHSFGGLITQMLLDRGCGVAGVVLDPAPPRGVIPGLRSVRSALPVLTAWNGWNRVLTMSARRLGRPSPARFLPVLRMLPTTPMSFPPRDGPVSRQRSASATARPSGGWIGRFC